MRMLRRTEFYPWPNGPCYRALCSLGLGGFPPAGARADQAGGASQVSARSEHARSLRRPGTRHAELRYRSVVPRYRYSGVRQFPIMQSRAQGTTRPRSAFVGADGLHAPSLRGGLTGCRTVRPHERRVQMLLTGVTPPRRSRVRAAAAVAAANSGPIGTHGLQPGVKSGEEMHRSTQAQKIGRWTAPPVFSHILPFNGLCLYGSCRPHLRP